MSFSNGKKFKPNLNFNVTGPLRKELLTRIPPGEVATHGLYLTVMDVAKRLGRSRTFVQRLLKTGQLPYTPISTRGIKKFKSLITEESYLLYANSIQKETS